MSATLRHAGFPTAPWAPPRMVERSPSIVLRCPECRRDMIGVSYHLLAQYGPSFSCLGCSATVKQHQEIWLALPESRQPYFAQFVREYEQIRRAEGRESSDAEFYVALPFRDLTGNHAWQWKIRGKTFRYIVRKILPKLMRKANSPLAILDLGAGNSWMSYRLARLGHRPVAIDLLTNSHDGLGAASHYRSVLPELFPRFQAELDNLPFGDGQFDCAIFNASFHYSENYDRTLTEAVRCLRPGGAILIADSPTYSKDASGQQMQKERQESFQKQFGFRSDGLASCEYLTPERLRALKVRHELEWTVHRIWYGIRWACRPMVAKWKNRREPSQFFLYSAQVKAR